MKRALVIADDLSGAAEIAGIGQRYGLATRLLRRPLDSTQDGLSVLDTDSRSLTPNDAGRCVRSFLQGLHADAFDLIYKKTDSVLRGPIAAEIDAIVASLGLSAALLLPQNPSRGRTIESGQYRIDDVPLDQTPFADDPEYPARTSDVKRLLGADHIRICDARDANDVSRWADQVGKNVLPAGGADFFEAVLEHAGLTQVHGFETALKPGRALFVCGSASAYSRELIKLARSRGAAIIAIDLPLDRTPGAAQRLLEGVTDSVVEALQKSPVTNLLVEGGSTAAAVCRRMGWNQFEVCGELAVGVVHLRAGTQDLVIKPGSYPWPEPVWKEI